MPLTDHSRRNSNPRAPKGGYRHQSEIDAEKFPFSVYSVAWRKYYAFKTQKEALAFATQAWNDTHERHEIYRADEQASADGWVVEKVLDRNMRSLSQVMEEIAAGKIRRAAVMNKPSAPSKVANKTAKPISTPTRPVNVPSKKVTRPPKWFLELTLNERKSYLEKNKGSPLGKFLKANLPKSKKAKIDPENKKKGAGAGGAGSPEKRAPDEKHKPEKVGSRKALIMLKTKRDADPVKTKKALAEKSRDTSPEARKPKSKTRRVAAKKIRKASSTKFAKAIGASPKDADQAAQAVLHAQEPMNKPGVRDFAGRSLMAGLSPILFGGSLVGLGALFFMMPLGLQLLAASAVISFVRGSFSGASLDERPDDTDEKEEYVSTPYLDELKLHIADLIESGTLGDIFDGLDHLDSNTDESGARDLQVHSKSAREAMARLAEHGIYYSTDPNVPSRFGPRNSSPIKRAAMSDRDRPTGFYVFATPTSESTRLLSEWAKQNKLPINSSKLHCTIMSSTVPAKGVVRSRGNLFKPYRARILGVKIMGDALVLELEAPALKMRRDDFVAIGGHDFHSGPYRPHITLLRGVSKLNLPDKIEPPSFDSHIEFGFEGMRLVFKDKSRIHAHETRAFHRPNSVIKKAMPGTAPMSHVQPEGMYMCLSVKSFIADKLYNWARDNDIPNIDPAGELHCTIVYSRTTPHVGFEGRGRIPTVEATVKGLKYLGPNALVLLLDCPDAKARFDEAKAAGCTSDFPSYIAHVTIASHKQDPKPFTPRDLKAIPLPQFPILFDYEFSCSLRDAQKDDWSVTMIEAKASALEG